MRVLFLLIYLAAGCWQVNGQYFNETFDFNSTLDVARSVVDKSNTIYVGSSFSNLQIEKGGILFYKLDQNGQILNSNDFLWQDFHVGCGISGSLKIHGEGFIQVATSYGSGLPYKIMLLKLNNDVDTIFTRQFIHGAGSIGRSAHVLPDQSIIVFGESIATASAQANLTIWKLDSLGNVLWVQAYPNAGEDFCVGGTVDDDGNIYISGGNGVYPNEKGLIIKADSIGTFVWKRLFSNTIGMSISYQYNTLWVSSAVYWNGNPNIFRVYLSRLTTGLVTIWDSVYGGLSNSAASTRPLIIGNKIYLAGNNLDQAQRGWLFMSDTLGQVQFERTYQAVPIGTDHYINDATPTADGGFALVGWTSNPGQNAWVVKVDSLGCLVPNCALSEEELPTTNELRLWPNPTTGILNILLPQSSGPAELSLTDITGRVVHHEWTANSTELVLEMNHLPPGMYFLQVRTAAGVLFTDKVVKQ